MVSRLIKSFFQIFRQIAFRAKPEVVFYSPQHFNRSTMGVNPYFEPMIDLCRKTGIRYICLEEPASTSYPADKKFIPADVFVYLLWLIHKICINGLGWSLHKTDKFAGRILDNITFHRLRAKTYITISNSLIDVLGEINPEGNVYDYQHGIIYYGHPGYFLSADELRPEFKLKNRRVLLWGELYKNNLRRLPGIADSEEKFIVAGYPMYSHHNINRNATTKSILVSMQFTSDISPKVTDGILEMLYEFIAEAVKQGYKVLLKHHPRFAGEVNLDYLMKRYEGKVTVTDRPINEIVQKIKIHVTWSSTTAMEYASYGIPTIFLRDQRFDWATEMFYGQYNYPLYDKMTYAEVLERVVSDAIYHEDCTMIKDWYNSAYAPLNNELILKILKGELFK